MWPTISSNTGLLPTRLQTLPELFRQRLFHHLPQHSSSKWSPLDAESSRTASTINPALKDRWIFHYLSRITGGISQSICWPWPVALGVRQRLVRIKRWSQFLPGIRNIFSTSKRAWIFDEQSFSADCSSIKETSELISPAQYPPKSPA